MSILNHCWGESAAADRIWAQVCGLRPSKAGQRTFMVLQAYFDESEEGGVYVVAGYISTAERWARFSEDWERMLPFGVRDQNGHWHFKMHEMAKNKERMDRVSGFYRIIEEHVMCTVMTYVFIPDIVNARNRIYVHSLRGNHSDLWGPVDPFYFCFQSILGGIAYLREHNDPKFCSVVGRDEPIDIYFDERSEKKQIISGWDSWVSRNPESRQKYFGPAPRFEDDKDFLPLQAADFQAWWVRKWIVERRHGVDWVYDGFDRLREIPSAFFCNDEDKATYYMYLIAQRKVPVNAWIVDKKGATNAYLLSEFFENVARSSLNFSRASVGLGSPASIRS